MAKCPVCEIQRGACISLTAPCATAIGPIVIMCVVCVADSDWQFDNLVIW